VHIHNWCGGGRWSDGVNVTEGKTKESIAGTRGERRRELSGTFNGLVLDGDAPNSDGILASELLQ
jgi:hypothetical protein